MLRNFWHTYTHISSQVKYSTMFNFVFFSSRNHSILGFLQRYIERCYFCYFCQSCLGDFCKKKNKTTILPNPTLWEKDKTVCQWTSRGSISWSTWCHNNPKNSLKVPNWTRFFYFIIDDFSVFNHHRRKFNLHFLLGTSKTKVLVFGNPNPWLSEDQVELCDKWQQPSINKWSHLTYRHL